MAFIFECASVSSENDEGIDPDRACTKVGCPNWNEIAMRDTAEELLASVITSINCQEIDDVNLWYRVTDDERNQVIITGDGYHIQPEQNSEENQNEQTEVS